MFRQEIRLLRPGIANTMIALSKKDSSQNSSGRILASVSDGQKVNQSYHGSSNHQKRIEQKDTATNEAKAPLVLCFLGDRKK